MTTITSKTRNLRLKLVRTEDAAFILSLRNDSTKNRYLSKTDASIDTQKLWINQYVQREAERSEYYFVLTNDAKEKFGTVRLYDFRDNSFCWGSWITSADSPAYSSIESALSVYEFAFFDLGYEQSHFDVRKANLKVVKFHQRFGAEIVDENEQDYFFNYKKEQYLHIRKKYSKYFPENHPY